MTQTASSITITPAGKLPGMPKGPLTPTQQLEAIRRVQAQAEQRIKLGLQLFKAAESHASHQQTVILQLKNEQAKLRDQLETDVTKSLHAYDQWVGKIDESFNRAMQSLEAKIKTMESEWGSSQQRMDTMVRRCEALMDQSRYMLDEIKRLQATAHREKIEVKAAQPVTPAPAPAVAASPPVPEIPAPPKPIDVPQQAEPPKRTPKVLIKPPAKPAPVAPTPTVAKTAIELAKPTDQDAAGETETAPQATPTVTAQPPPAAPPKPPLKVVPPTVSLAVQVEAVKPEPADIDNDTDEDHPLSVSPSMLEEAQAIVDDAGDDEAATDTTSPEINLGPPVSYTDIINRFGQSGDVDDR